MEVSTANFFEGTIGMSVEQELYEVINIAELPLPDNIKIMRYRKTLGEFYVKLAEKKPSPLYEKITPYHMDYLSDLLSIELSFRDKDYNKVLSQLKTLFLDKEGYILQGRVYYNLQSIFERHLEKTLTELAVPVPKSMESINEPNIFEYRVDKKGRKALKKHFSKTLTRITPKKKREEFNRFNEILEEWKINNGSNRECLDIIFDFIKKGIKTDPLTLVLFHADTEGQCQVMRIVREKEFPFQEYILFKTDGSHYYLPDNTMFSPVKDFRIAILISILQRSKE